MMKVVQLHLVAARPASFIGTVCCCCFTPGMETFVCGDFQECFKNPLERRAGKKLYPMLVFVTCVEQGQIHWSFN